MRRLQVGGAADVICSEERRVGQECRTLWTVLERNSYETLPSRRRNCPCR